jgi:N-acetylglucosamine kinase-like BadF-type ATPase
VSPIEPVPAVVGVDGGNSKTDLVIADDSGSVLARVRGRGTHPHRDGPAATAEQLAELLSQARLRAGLASGATLTTGVFCVCLL